MTGFFLVVIGFEQSLGGAQHASTLLWLRAGFNLVPIAVFGVSLLAVNAYL